MIQHRNRLRSTSHIFKALLLVGVAAPSVAWGQADASNNGQSAEEPADANEILVTALRRSTRLQETPLAISAVSGESLQASGTSSFTELTKSAPSLRIVDSGPGNRRVLIRGIQSSGEPTVGVYYDEVPVSGSVSTSSDAAGTTPDFRLFDVERAEVLRGPQGTLFGSGSMGGTLRVIFKKPNTNEFEAATSANISTVKYGKPGGSVDAMINVPVVEGKAAVRVVGFYNKFAGYVDNIRLGLKDVNDGDSYGGRVLVRLTPTDQTTVDFAMFYEKVATDSPRWMAESGTKFATSGYAESGNYDTNRIYNMTLKHDFDTMVLTAVTSYFDRDRTAVSDVSDTFIGRDTAARCQTYLTRTRACTETELSSYLTDTRKLFSSSLYQPQSVKNWVNEVRLSSDGSGDFNWTVGGFIEDRKTVVRSTLLLGDPLTGELYSLSDSSAIKYDRTINDHLKQSAAYAELSYKMFDKLTLTAGSRYYSFKKTVGGRIDVGQIHYSSVVTPYTEAKSNEDGLIYKFNASYNVSPRLMVYAQAAQGFRPGGVNQVIGLPAALAAYSADSLWNYELGFKSTVTSGVTFNLAGYRIDWDNLQVSARTSGTGSVFGLIANAGAARIEGLEAELTANVSPGLTFSGNFGYTDAKLSQDQVSTVVTATGKRGDRLAFVPRFTGGASMEYQWPVSDELNGIVRLDANMVSTSYSTLAPADVYRRRIDPYQVVNFRLGTQREDGKWAAYFYVNNLLDDTAITSSSSSSNSGGKTLLYSIAPRTLGINVTRRF